MTMPPESRRKALDAFGAVGGDYPASEDFEAIQRAPTGSDAELIAERTRRALAELRQDLISGWVRRGLMSESDGWRLRHDRR
jgi:hypothetical protein